METNKIAMKIADKIGPIKILQNFTDSCINLFDDIRTYMLTDSSMQSCDCVLDRMAVEFAQLEISISQLEPLLEIDDTVNEMIAVELDRMLRKCDSGDDTNAKRQTN